MKNYMRRLGEALKARIPYIAVPECRFSGVGFPAIPLHFHFLAACPKQWKGTFDDIATSLWEEMGGHCKIEPYESTLPGAFYIAKLASSSTFDWCVENIERLSHHGPADLFLAAQNSSFVPEHAKGGSSTLKTLTVSSPLAKSSALQSIATAKHAQPQIAKSVAQGKGTLNGLKPVLPPGPSVPLIDWVWRKHVKQTTGVSVAQLTAMQRGQLKHLRNKLGPATLPIIEYAIHNWSKFGKRVVLETPYEGAPSSPAIGFLCSFYLIAARIAYESAKNKFPRTPADWKIIDVWPLL